MKPKPAQSSRGRRSAKSEPHGKRSAEVCAALGIQPYVLKFWEGEFPQLGRRLGGKRLYGATELRIVGEIQEMVDTRGMTLAEARRVLAERWPDGAEAPVATTEAAPAKRGRSTAAEEPEPAAGAARIRALEDRIERLQDEMRRLRTAETDRERLSREVERLRGELVGADDAESRDAAAAHAEELILPEGVGDLAGEIESCLDDARRLSAEIDALLVALAPIADGGEATAPAPPADPPSTRRSKSPGPRPGRGKSGS